MKLKTNTNTIELLQKVRECAGEVIFQTDEGDVMNLKSTLSCYVFSVVNTNPEIVAGGRILCRDKADYAVLKDFFDEE